MDFTRGKRGTRYFSGQNEKAMQHICQKLGIEMTCSAFADAFEAEIKLRPS